jgi:hypothetical protein
VTGWELGYSGVAGVAVVKIKILSVETEWNRLFMWVRESGSGVCTKTQECGGG